MLWVSVRGATRNGMTVVIAPIWGYEYTLVKSRIERQIQITFVAVEIILPANKLENTVTEYVNEATAMLDRASLTRLQLVEDPKIQLGITFQDVKKVVSFFGDLVSAALVDRQVTLDSRINL
jgi:hypothetical protein